MMNVSRYDETARGVHVPLYAYYAEKIKAETGVVSGSCLDAGCGGGYLGLALSKITDLRFIFFDRSAEMLQRAEAHIVEDGLRERARTLHGDVHDIPLPDGTLDLVISRGSIPFWKDPGAALLEFYRLLAPKGQAFVGGGKGTPEMRRRFEAEREQAGKMSSRGRRGKKDPWAGPLGRMKHRDYHVILEETGIPSYSIHDGDDGRWIQLWKSY